MSKLVYKNFFFLFLVQFSNYVLPFLVIPLLTRTLGVEGFGKYAFYLGIANGTTARILWHLCLY